MAAAILLRKDSRVIQMQKKYSGFKLCLGEEDTNDQRGNLKGEWGYTKQGGNSEL